MKIGEFFIYVFLSAFLGGWVSAAMSRWIDRRKP